jgi:hypothetical protein
MEVYINGIIVMTRQGSSLILDLEETFTNLKHFNIRLNPKKMHLWGPPGQSPGLHHHQAWH